LIESKITLGVIPNIYYNSHLQALHALPFISLFILLIDSEAVCVNTKGKSACIERQADADTSLADHFTALFM